MAGRADRSKASTPGADPRGVSFLTGYAPAPHLLLRNNGDGTFADQTAAAKLSAVRTGAQAVAVVPTDYDNRRDVDLLVVHSDAPPALYRNLRDGTFRDVAAEVGLDFKGRACSAAAAGDVNKDGFTDFFFACRAEDAANAPGLFALSDGKGRFNTRPAPPASAPRRGRAVPRLRQRRPARPLDASTATRRAPPCASCATRATAGRT